MLMMGHKSMAQLHVSCTCLLLSLSATTLAQSAPQFIYYNNTIAGSFRHPSSAPSTCPTYYFNSIVNSSVQVGVNPPWDTNPFSFAIGHFGNRVVPGAGQACYDVGGCTNDAIFNLDFATAHDECLQNGALCPDGILTGTYEYVGLEIVNLNASTVIRLNSLGTDNEKGYSVAGDQSSFVGNGTVIPSFDFQRPTNYSLGDGCIDSLFFQWNNTTPFTYSVNFTNATAVALFTLVAPNGSISFSLSGSRVDDLLNPNDAENPYDNGNYSVIALSTSNSSLPHFTFANGTAIVWQGFSNGEWGAVSVASSASMVACSMVLWILTVVAVVLLL